MIYYAHTRKDLPEEKWQTLKEHLLDTAKIASGFVENQEIIKYAEIAGLLHDFGKYQEEFQNYLRNGGRRGSVPHARWGALLADCIQQQEVSFAIDGHHKGIPDETDWFNVDISGRQMEKKDKEKLTKLLNEFISDTGISQEKLLIRESSFLSQLDAQEKELFTRYIFSCITDADWLNTEKFMDGVKASSRIQKVLEIDKMIKIMEDKFLSMNKDGEINIMRNQTREEALKGAEKKIGFFTLNLPTGMGKTLTSIYWALKHAKKYKLKRIIVVLPFISIIDQTAKELKGLFGDDVVLEHHSNLSIENENIKKDEKYNPKELATENWDYPIIVTTTVQFFESLFSNKPSKCRKIHNIADAVIIFDEVQTLPKEMILPTLSILKNINKILKTSFLFCTATMPAFNKRDGFNGIEGMINLISKPKRLFENTIRVKYHSFKGFKPASQAEILGKIKVNGQSTLVIFNTKKEAKAFYEIAVNESCWNQTYHLSTYMCPAHRKDVISKIREDLRPSCQKKILVVSTQLIEAGVDFDFPVVYRAMAPLESIIQSAGRCNREGILKNSEGKLKKGDVYIFEPEGSGMPDKTYKACAQHAKLLIAGDLSKLYNYDIFRKYYEDVLGLYINADKHKIDEMRNNLNFQQVNDSYRIIENATEALFIKDYNEESKAIMKEIENKEYLIRDDFRRIQQYSVQVYRNLVKRNYGIINPLPQGINAWIGKYDENTGIIEEGNFIF